MLCFSVFFFLRHAILSLKEMWGTNFVLIVFNSILDQTDVLFHQKAVSPSLLVHINFLLKNSVVVFWIKF